jgi:hypothetical protein
MLDITLTESSGALVPYATTVKPTTRAEIPNERANREAPLTSQSAPRTRRTKPTMRRSIVIIMDEKIEV